MHSLIMKNPYRNISNSWCVRKKTRPRFIAELFLFYLFIYRFILYLSLQEQ